MTEARVQGRGEGALEAYCLLLQQDGSRMICTVVGGRALSLEGALLDSLLRSRQDRPVCLEKWNLLDRPKYGKDRNHRVGHFVFCMSWSDGARWNSRKWRAPAQLEEPE